MFVQLIQKQSGYLYFVITITEYSPDEDWSCDQAKEVNDTTELPALT
jgi:hypothetical protein